MTTKPRKQDPIRIIVRPLNLAMHEIEVEMSLPADLAGQGPVMTLPAWTPGSYLVRDYARFLDRVKLRDASGLEREIRKVDKQSWQLQPIKGVASLSYRLFCNELSVRTNHVDANHAFLTGAATFLYPEAHPDRPFEVRFEDFPDAWKVATALPCVKGSYRAENLDALVDSPFELGTFRLHHFDIDGTKFEFAFTGEHASDEARIVEATRKIVEVCGRLFRGFPFKRYLFLLTWTPGLRGGLEHRDSTALISDPMKMDGPDGYHDLCVLIAHEFFHAWNVKRFRDGALGPFDYARENITRLLWFHEGFTSYMQFVIALKAGVIQWPYVARKLAIRWTDYCTRAGRFEQSLEESSFDAWIRHYKPTEFDTNSTVSYYEKGALVAWMMDGTMRLATGSRHGVEDLFGLLWKQIGDGPMTDEDLRKAYKRICRLDPEPFWHDFVQGKAELDASLVEQAFGLQFDWFAPWDFLTEEEARDPIFLRRAKIYSGLDFDSEAPVVHNVEPGSPAALAGMTYGQEILAVNGWRTVCAADVQKCLGDGKPGHRMEILAAHRGRVCNYHMKLRENPKRTVQINPVNEPSDRQRAAFMASFGIQHPAPILKKSKP